MEQISPTDFRSSPFKRIILHKAHLIPNISALFTTPQNNTPLRVCSIANVLIFLANLLKLLYHSKGALIVHAAINRELKPEKPNT